MNPGLWVSREKWNSDTGTELTVAKLYDWYRGEDWQGSVRTSLTSSLGWARVESRTSEVAGVPWDAGETRIGQPGMFPLSHYGPRLMDIHDWLLRRHGGQRIQAHSTGGGVLLLSSFFSEMFLRRVNTLATQPGRDSHYVPVTQIIVLPLFWPFWSAIWSASGWHRRF